LTHTYKNGIFDILPAHLTACVMDGAIFRIIRIISCASDRLDYIVRIGSFESHRSDRIVRIASFGSHRSNRIIRIASFPGVSLRSTPGYRALQPYRLVRNRSRFSHLQRMRHRQAVRSAGLGSANEHDAGNAHAVRCAGNISTIDMPDFVHQCVIDGNFR
jgi:hypothetical protein